MPLFWLRISFLFYSVGLLYALSAVSRPCTWLQKYVIPIVGVGMVFHVVSLAETAMITGHLSLTRMSVYDSESLLAFLILTVFMIVYAKYKTIAPGIFVFPLAFLMTFAAAMGQQPVVFTSEVMRSGWLFAHIATIFTGYAALFLSFAASLLYIVQEKTLKSKQPSNLMGRLPALQVIDDIGYKSLMLGFPFMTFGLICGAVIAQSQFGPQWFTDPKVVLSLLMWAVYMVLLYTRWNSGWRGRRAAYLATFAFLTAIGAWAANFFSSVHRFVAP
ncbi:MAG TPA: cytochrome c biogenesis protein CcsA [Terriglobales bacterium]|nr:cytochrome c biogenesis protein CcsA [Terriglobales bacterium]